MKVTETQLADLWRGSSHYRLLLLKGDRIRFVITKQDPLANDDRTHRITTERTLMEVMPHWEKLYPDDDEPIELPVG